jgi:DNA transformation protein and related proteins
MKHNEFIEFLLADQLAVLTGLSARAMFGGFGIYLDGTIVGIVVDDELYLKVDDTNRAEYLAMGSVPFTYIRNNDTATSISMSYWKIPAEVLEDRELLLRLVEDSYVINLKKEASKNTKRKKH